MKITERITIILSVFMVALLFMSACSETDPSARSDQPPAVLIVGGGEHHDFGRWFQVEDSTIIAGTGADVRYTEDISSVLPSLSDLDILYMNTNQSVEDPELRNGVFEFVENGGGLLLVHASIWYGWDWPEFYRDLTGGGTYSHGPYGEFEVYVVDETHPVMPDVPLEFSIRDELYRFQYEEEGTDIHVLAVGIEPDTGDEYPVVWTTMHGEGRIVNTTLGHDGAAHQHEAFISILENSIKWLSE